MLLGKLYFLLCEFITELAASLMLIAPDILHYRQDNAELRRKIGINPWRHAMPEELYLLSRISIKISRIVDRDACKLHQRVEFEGRPHLHTRIRCATSIKIIGEFFNKKWQIYRYLNKNYSCIFKQKF